MMANASNEGDSILADAFPSTAAVSNKQKVDKRLLASSSRTQAEQLPSSSPQSAAGRGVRSRQQGQHVRSQSYGGRQTNFGGPTSPTDGAGTQEALATGTTKSSGHRRTRSYGFQDVQKIEFLEPEWEIEAVDWQTDCGFSFYRPHWLQRFATKGWMLFWMCWFCAVQGLIVNGLVPSSLSTLERRFEFTSSFLGRITQFYDIGYVVCCIPVSYFGGRHSKPLFLGAGLLIMGFGSFLFSAPHIFLPPYSEGGRYSGDGNRSEQESLSLCLDIASFGRRNNSVKAVLRNDSFCSPQSSPSSFRAGEQISYSTLFCLANFLHGVGATPLFTLGVTYIDENVSPAVSSMFLGIFYAFAVFGPAFGFFLSFIFLRFHTDFLMGGERPIKFALMDESDPSWVGAWWAGFQIAAVLALVAVLPIASFPKVLPDAIEWHRARLRTTSALRRRNRSIRTRLEQLQAIKCGDEVESASYRKRAAGDEAGASVTFAGIRSVDSTAVESNGPLLVPTAATVCSNGSTATTPIDGEKAVTPASEERSSTMLRNPLSAIPFILKLWLDLRHIPAAVKRIVTNPCYMCITLGAAFDGLVITGASTFMAKYLERQFNVAPSKANLLIGCIMVPMAGVGTMTSGFVVKHFRFTCEKTLKFSVAMLILSLILSPMYLIYCDHDPVVGIEVHYPMPKETANRVAGGANNNTVSLRSACNEHCSCSADDLQPLCAEFWPGQRPLSFYSPCFAGCPQPYDPLRTEYSNCSCVPTGTVRKGWCRSHCGGLVGFLILFAPLCFCTFAVGVPLLSVVLRVVDYHERAFALGIQWILLRCIGTIPAPVLFGWLFDVSCIRRHSALAAAASCPAAASFGQLPAVAAGGSCYIYFNKLLSDLFLAFSVIGQSITLMFLVLALVFFRRKEAGS